MKCMAQIAATNRPEVLDPALLRAGRFDRHVHIGLPDAHGRKEILRVHVQRVTHDASIDLDTLAKATPHFSGAELASLVNDAACGAVRRGAGTVGQADLLRGLARVTQFRRLSASGHTPAFGRGEDLSEEELL
jgi:cell division protease FtsH